MNAMGSKSWKALLIVASLVGFSMAGSAGMAAESEELSEAAALLKEGSKHYEAGALNQAVEAWSQAALLYEQGEQPLQESRVRRYLAQAYRGLGQPRQALEHLDLAQALARQADDAAQVTVTLTNLGSLYLDLGQLDAASEILQDALERARALDDFDLAATILNETGRLLAVQLRYGDAVEAFTRSAKSAQQAGNQALRVRALINAAKAATELEQDRQARSWLDQAHAAAVSLSAPLDRMYSLVSIGVGYDRLRRPGSEDSDALLLKAAEIFKTAAAMAEEHEQQRAASYAWGYWGRLYETEHRYEEALRLTHRAVLAAQAAETPESLYRWQWQLGRVHVAQGHLDEAITAYRLAVATLQPIRQEVAASSFYMPTGFRERIRSLYFELADLLLTRAGLTPQNQAEPYLREARQAIELLKAAEIRNYFRDDCVDALQARETSLDEVSRTAAVIYPIIFQDRLELLVSVAGGLERVTVPIGADQLGDAIRTFRRYLEKRTTREYLPHAQRLYDWLIRPLKPVLAKGSIDTLVFVPGGPLRTIPMSALHDGEDFLIHTYAVATTPALNLTDPHRLKRGDIKVLAVGLTESVQGFPPLPYVSVELETVQSLYPGNQLVNQEYILPRVEQELKDETFTIVHIASHGQFEPQVDQSFVLTFDDRLTMSQLDQFVGLFRFREEPLELLTLSACKTAAGDERAALGLAGVAIKAGARSALATLWFINDRASSALVSEFYRQLHDKEISKADALRSAQLTMLEDPLYHHPAYWAPFLLLNNWL